MSWGYGSFGGLSSDGVHILMIERAEQWLEPEKCATRESISTLSGVRLSMSLSTLISI